MSHICDSCPQAFRELAGLYLNWPVLIKHHGHSSFYSHVPCLICFNTFNSLCSHDHTITIIVHVLLISVCLVYAQVGPQLRPETLNVYTCTDTVFITGHNRLGCWFNTASNQGSARAYQWMLWVPSLVASSILALWRRRKTPGPCMQLTKSHKAPWMTAKKHHSVSGCSQNVWLQNAIT